MVSERLIVPVTQRTLITYQQLGHWQMGKKAREVKADMRRTIRSMPLSDGEKAFLHEHAIYEGSPLHKKNPGDFGLTPPAAPRLGKTLCDEAAITQRADARALLGKAIDGGLASEATTAEGFPKQLWVVDDHGRVFEAIYGGSQTGHYHGYPIRNQTAMFDQITKAWAKRS